MNTKSSAFSIGAFHKGHKKTENPLEKVIESKVCAYARSLNFYVAKFVSPQRVSVPDRIFHYKGKTFYIEFKRLGERPRPAQVIEIEKLRSHGIEVFVVDSVELGKTILNRIVLEAE